MKTKLFFLLLWVLIFTIACKEEEPYSPPSDPAKAILGKWEIYQMHGLEYVITNPPEYIEYLPDSLIRRYDYETKEVSYLDEKYWIDSILLYRSGIPTDNTPYLMEYGYEFYEDKMKLYPFPFSGNHYYINPTVIYKRIK
jgi:hypothetical protein